jgi:hypothetical protein
MKTDLEIITEKILTGIKIANRKLVENAAANNETLIVSGKNGKPAAVSAKELLKKM